MSNYLVIGGSSGIGYEVVKKLASNNNKIYIMSRNPNKIEDVENITKISYDVTCTEEGFPSIEEPLKGLVYCPGTINLKPIRNLKLKIFQMILM